MRQRLKGWFDGHSQTANRVIAVLSVLVALGAAMVARMGSISRLFAPSSWNREEVSGMAPFALLLVIAVPVLLMAVKSQKAK